MIMPETYVYTFGYDRTNKSFLGQVCTSEGWTIYEIEDSSQMLDLIDAGYMNHIDDYQGLEDMLKQDKIISFCDNVRFGGVFNYER